MSRTREDIRAAIEEIHAVRGQRLALMDSAELGASELSAQIARLETDLEEVRVYVDDRRSKSVELERDLAAAEAFSVRADGFLDELAQRAGEALVAWKPTLKDGISWARVARLAQADRLISALATDGEERERALLEFWAFLGEELRLSHTLDERNELITLEGGPRSEHAYVLRLGLLQELFVSEDGTLAGLHTPAQGWKLELDPGASEGIRTLSKIARGKAGAALSPAPFPSARVRRGN